MKHNRSKFSLLLCTEDCIVEGEAGVPLVRHNDVKETSVIVPNTPYPLP